MSKSRLSWRGCAPAKPRSRTKPKKDEPGRWEPRCAPLVRSAEHAFTEAERRQLALLQLFQGFVDLDALVAMGRPTAEWRLPEVRGLTREAVALLDRAAEVGLLTAHGGGYYSIHPALPWFFKKLFDEFYPYSGMAATRAFVQAMGGLGNYYMNQYNRGNLEVIDVLVREEANLLHARRLARAHGWWPRVISTMQGLRTLYHQTGRRAEWARLVEEIVPDFVDPGSDGPLPGREEAWSLVTEYRVRLAEEELQWAEPSDSSALAWDGIAGGPLLRFRHRRKTWTTREETPFGPLARRSMNWERFSES